jgi:hypothetical protein
LERQAWGELYQLLTGSTRQARNALWGGDTQEFNRSETNSIQVQRRQEKGVLARKRSSTSHAFIKLGQEVPFDGL